MTQDEIIRMAREAGLPVDDSLGFPLAHLNESTIFAFNVWIKRFFNLAFAAGAAHEREAVLEIVHAIGGNFADECAAAIRARGEK